VHICIFLVGDGILASFGLRQRKKTLLKEYEQSGKSSVFLDKRIGEQNDELGEFDKAILRSQRERQVCSFGLPKHLDVHLFIYRVWWQTYILFGCGESAGL
jgi:hypothetical protein